ncbi:MAG TPA: TetR/AcrR family transcriptional regulator, partial [Candidatus Aveggerthella stercoripullorum]|nr:TetR/AcrR family transcriptional regulator [Candidatus Aveggerthella stercoripullorum]
ANVYNYFQNKDEILLALLQREHELWADDLASLRESGMTPDNESLADGIAASLEKRTQMLKLLAMNLYDIEQNSRLESLVAFKHAYKRVVDELERLLRTSKPHWDEARASRFVFGLVPYTHGVYPFVFHSAKQLAAMSAANVAHPELSIRTLVRDLALSLLRDET